eukprot:SAG31_NODE_1079_length_10031_cov_5.270741_11_plen_66_part_00
MFQLPPLRLRLGQLAATAAAAPATRHFRFCEVESDLCARTVRNARQDVADGTGGRRSRGHWSHRA